MVEIGSEGTEPKGEKGKSEDKAAVPVPASAPAVAPVQKRAEPAPRPGKGPAPKPKPRPAGDRGAAPPDPAAFEEAFRTAYRNLSEKLHAVWYPVDLGQAVAEARRELEHSLARHDGPDQDLERCEAQLAYLRAVRRAASPERRRAQIAFAFSRYLDELKAIWARPDLDRIDPRLISAFGESIAWAGYHASQWPGD